jgi:hypothetical protein
MDTGKVVLFIIAAIMNTMPFHVFQDHPEYQDYKIMVHFNLNSMLLLFESPETGMIRYPALVFLIG